jgi:hypothetical protein
MWTGLDERLRSMADFCIGDVEIFVYIRKFISRLIRVFVVCFTYRFGDMDVDRRIILKWITDRGFTGLDQTS